MSRTLASCAALLLVVGLTLADDAPVTVRVLTTDGKPAAGAKVWVYSYRDPGEEEKAPTELVADAAGTVGVTGGNDRPRQVFARDAAGRVGASWFWRNRGPDDESTGVKVVLADTAPRAGRITAAGRPVGGATVVPTGHTSEARGRRAEPSPAYSIGLPEWEQPRLAVTTDADGRFRLPAVAGYSVGFRVKAAGFGETRFVATGGAELDAALVAPGSVTLAADGVDPAVLKGVDWRLDADRDEEDASPGVRPLRYAMGAFDGTAKLTVPNLPPGRYTLHVYDAGRNPAAFVKAESVEVVSGKAAALTATFGPTAKVTGTITDKATGKGVAGVSVVVNVTGKAAGGRPDHQYHVTTDADGTFVAHGAAGWYGVWLRAVPDGYAVPHVPDGRRLAEPKQLALGQSHAFPAIALPHSVTLAGQVVLPDGKPAAGATVATEGFHPQPSAKARTDAAGTFALKNLPPDDAVAPRVRLGTAVNVPQTIELDKTTKPVTVEVSEANAAGFKGRVTDAKGKPVGGASVRLMHHIQGVGRNSSYSTTRPTETATTDADGRYTFAGQWPRDNYHVHVTAAGYTVADSKQRTGAAGEVGDFGTLALTRAGLAVPGVVRDAGGKPVAGADVFGVDGPARFATTSGPDGSFTLTGYAEGGGFAFARKVGYRLAAVPVTPGGSEPVALVLVKADAPPGPQPEVTAAHKAALDRLTRHVLTRIWEMNAEFGYGGNAISQMARIDLDTAKRWRDEEKKRAGGKDFTHSIERAGREKTLFDTAKQDIDEALAVLAPVRGDDGFTETMQLGERLLPVDRAKAARVAEEAVVRARQREFPAKLWSLAEAGDLAVRAGNAAGGEKVLLEAADLAGKVSAEGRDRESMAVGLVAARLAAHDWPRAEALLNTITDASEFNRWLAASAGRLAATDLPRAKGLLDRFKPDNSYSPSEGRLRVALAVAATQPDEAVEVVEGVTEPAYRFHGYVMLAGRFAGTDKARAAKTIGAAFDLLERQPEGFQSWSNYGGRAGFAAVAAVRAKEAGYPDVADLVARALAMRETGDEWSADGREERAVNVAAALARVDPAAARRVLATVAPPEAFAERALEKRRDWLFALALADPDRAVPLVDKLLERAKTRRDGRNALSGTGVVELGSILTDRDSLRELTTFGNLPRALHYE